MPHVTQTVQYVIDYMKGKGIDVSCRVEGSHILLIINHDYDYDYNNKLIF